MKKLILATLILGLAGAGVQISKAGDREWAVAGKVLTGVAVASVITHAVAAEPAPVYYSYSYSSPGYGFSYCPPPRRVVYVQPAPVVVYRAPVCVAPAPVCFVPAAVNIRFGFGGGGRHHFRHSNW